MQGKYKPRGGEAASLTGLGNLAGRIHPAAPMVLQRGPEVPEWLPRVLPKCKDGPLGCSRGGKMVPRNLVTS